MFELVYKLFTNLLNITVELQIQHSLRRVMLSEKYQIKLCHVWTSISKVLKTGQVLFFRNH